jgi:hypothetical protein
VQWKEPQERQGTFGEIVFDAYVVDFVLVKVQDWKGLGKRQVKFRYW